MNGHVIPTGPLLMFKVEIIQDGDSSYRREGSGHLYSVQHRKPCVSAQPSVHVLSPIVCNHLPRKLHACGIAEHPIMNSYTKLPNNPAFQSRKAAADQVTDASYLPM